MGSWKIIHRLVILALLPAVLTAVFLTAYFSGRTIEELDDTLSKQGEALARSLALAAVPAMRGANAARLEAITEAMLASPDVVGIRITAPDGEALVHTRDLESWSTPPNPALLQVAGLLGDSPTQQFRFTVPYAAGGRDAEVSVTLSAMPTRYRQASVIVQGTAIVLVILGLTALGALSAGRSLSIPLQRVLRTVNAIQDGDLNARVEVANGAELGELERGINTMATHIQGAHAKLQYAVNAATGELRIKVEEVNQKNHELELARSRAEDANLAKSRFLANMSHELRTPLNAIIGFADLLGECRLDETHRDYVETIGRSASELLVIINEILDYSKIESGQMKVEEKPLDFYELIEGVIDLLSKSAQEKGLDFLLYVDPEIPAGMITDPLRLKQTLINLLSNAIKFTETGHIALEIHQRRQADGTPQLDFRIMDTGIGIDEVQREKIFQPFVQGDDSPTRNHAGTGLGLSITRFFIEKLGGRIDCSSEPGRGTTFRFTLPYRPHGEPRPYYLAAGTADLNVLVYDRNTLRAAYTRQLLTAWGMRVRHTATIGRFIDEYASPEYQAILYYLNRSDVDTDLQISIHKLAEVPAIKFFMHNSKFHGAPDSAAGFVHLHNVITPARLYGHLTGQTCCEPLAAEPETEFLEQEPTDLSGLRVLVADDNEINQHLLEVYITRNNGEMLQAADGQIAIDVALAERPDAILMDVHMPNVDGITAMQTITRSLPDIPVVAVTANADPDQQQYFLEAGFDTCLIKPVTERMLISTVLRCLHGRPPTGNVGKGTPPPDAPAPNALPLLDVDKAVRLAGGNRTLALELYTMLMADLKSKRSQLVFNGPQDRHDLRETTHKIRGGAKYCAAEQVQWRAAQLEKAIDTGRSDLTVGNAMSRLIEAINDLLASDNPYQSAGKGHPARQRRAGM